MEQWKKVIWSDESHFYLYHMDGRVRVHHLPGEDISPGSTVGRKQASGGNVMLWAMFCWEALGPGIHVEVNLTHATYKTSLWTKYSPGQKLSHEWTKVTIVNYPTLN